MLSNMGSEDESPHQWTDDGETRGNGWSPIRKDSTSLGEYRHLPLEDGSDTGEPSALDTEPLLPLMETKLYKRRWVMLFIFCLNSMSNAFMWLQYSIIGDIFMRFYGVSSLSID